MAPCLSAANLCTKVDRLARRQSCAYVGSTGENSGTALADRIVCCGDRCHWRDNAINLDCGYSPPAFWVRNGHRGNKGRSDGVTVRS